MSWFIEQGYFPGCHCQFSFCFVFSTSLKYQSLRIFWTLQRRPEKYLQIWSAHPALSQFKQTWYTSTGKLSRAVQMCRRVWENLIFRYFLLFSIVFMELSVFFLSISEKKWRLPGSTFSAALNFLNLFILRDKFNFKQKNDKSKRWSSY